jgi:hypothetical protein
MKTNPKTLAFYFGSITFVVVSFTLIVDYGNKNLHPPASISGQYLIEATSGNIATCFSAQPMLVIGQSGTYLNADLVSSDAKKQKLSRALKGNGALNGQVSEGQIHLEGQNLALGTCPKSPVTVEATIKEGKVTGQLRWNGETILLNGSTAPEAT